MRESTILVVTQSAESLHSLSQVLMAHGCRVLGADSCDSALAALATGQADLILLDTDMPEMAGLSVLQRLKAEPDGQATPIIIVSHSLASEHTLECFKLGAADVVLKPVQNEILQARVQAQVDLGRVRRLLEAKANELEQSNQKLQAEVAERRQAEVDLFHTKELLEAAGQTARFGGWSIELPSMTLHWTNEAYRIHEIPVGTPITVAQAIDSYDEESRPAIAEALRNCIHQGAKWDLELRLITPSGTPKWIRNVGQPELVDDKVMRIYGGLLDVSAERDVRAALVDSQRRMSLLVQHAAAYIYELDADAKIIFVNRLPDGLRQDEIIGSSILDQIVASHRPAFFAALANAFALSQEQGVEYDMIDATGQCRSYEAQVLPVIGEEIRSVILTANDLTERKKFERKLFNSRELLRQFLDHFPGMAYVKDGDLRLQMANVAFSALLGRDLRDIVGRSTEELFPGAFGKKLSNDDRRILKTGVAETITEELHGHIFETTKFVIQEGDKRYLGGITSDVTNRLRNYQRTQALLNLYVQSGELPEREFLRYGLQAAETLTASEIGFLHFVNDDQETIELVTWTDGALRGCQAAYDNHYPVSQAGIWADCFRERRPVVFNDYQAYQAKKGLPDGHATISRLISVPVIEDGMVRMMMGVGNKKVEYDEFDVQSVQLIGNDLWRAVRRQRAETALNERLAEVTSLNQKFEQAQSQLLQSDKMATIGQLAAGVAHELNNPIGFIQSNLGSLKGYVDDLLEILEASCHCANSSSDAAGLAALRSLRKQKDLDFLKDDIKQLLTESKDGADRVRRIVQNLKDFAHVSEEEWNWSDLHRGLDSTLNLVWNEIKYKATVDKQYDDLPEVRCVASQINQVFMNLLVNAAQAIETKGTIAIRTGFSEGQTPEQSSVWVDIVDSGKGIPEENLKRIFDPFFTTKPVGKGTGLGLSLAWSIVRKHGGTLEVTSVVGEGTRFRMTLPVDTQQPQDSDQT